MTGYEKPLNRPISQQTIHALHDPIIPFGGTAQVCKQAEREQETNNLAMAFGSYDPRFLLHAAACAYERNGAMIESQQFLVDAYNRAIGLIDPKTGKAMPPAVTTSGDITTRRWINRQTGAENRQVILGSGTHGWAGSTDHGNDIWVIGVPNSELDASSEMLKFLKDHPLVD